MKKNNTIWIVGIVIFLIVVTQLNIPKESGMILTPRYYKDGLEVFPTKGLFSIVTPPGGIFDQISFDISVTNTGNVPISDMQIVDAYPLIFKNSLATTTQLLEIGQTKKLWTSGLMDTSQFESISPVNFWINVSGEHLELGTIYQEAYSGNIEFLSDCVPQTCSEFGYTCGIQDDGCGGTINCGTCGSDEMCVNGACIYDGITINPISPTSTQDVTICLTASDSYGISLVRIYLRREEPEYNWGLVMDADNVDSNGNGKYCITLSPSLMKANEGDLERSYYMTVRNKNYVTILTTPIKYYSYNYDGTGFFAIQDYYFGGSTLQDTPISSENQPAYPTEAIVYMENSFKWIGDPKFDEFKVELTAYPSGVNLATFENLYFNDGKYFMDIEIPMYAYYEYQDRFIVKINTYYKDGSWVLDGTHYGVLFYLQNEYYTSYNSQMNVYGDLDTDYFESVDYPTISFVYHGKRVNIEQGTNGHFTPPGYIPGDYLSYDINLRGTTEMNGQKLFLYINDIATICGRISYYGMNITYIPSTTKEFTCAGGPHCEPLY